MPKSRKRAKVLRIAYYVLGFLFRADCKSVILIRKSKPKWQSGRLNGVGGKIEESESPIEALNREFKEETGADTTLISWREFCELRGNDFRVFCFTARDSVAWESARTMERERVEKHVVCLLGSQKVVSNLKWLIEMALDENDGNPFFATVEYGRVKSARVRP